MVDNAEEEVSVEVWVEVLEEEEEEEEEDDVDELVEEEEVLEEVSVGGWGVKVDAVVVALFRMGSFCVEDSVNGIGWECSSLSISSFRLLRR